MAESSKPTKEHAITPTERGILRHALGLSGRSGNEYRNHYATGPGCSTYDACVRLESLGLMTSRPPTEVFPDTFFFVTEEGRRYARECPAPDVDAIAREAAERVFNTFFNTRDAQPDYLAKCYAKVSPIIREAIEKATRSE